MARVDLSSRLSALIPTDAPHVTESTLEQSAPVLTVVSSPADEKESASFGPVAAPATGSVDRPTDAAATAPPTKRPKKQTSAPYTRPVSTGASQPMPEALGEEQRASKGVGVLLPESLDARLRSHHDATKKSFPTILMDAVDGTYDQLPALIAKAMGREVGAPSSSLFGRPVGQERRALNTEETTIRHTIRLTERNVMVLDDLTDQMQAPSRTFLVVTALDAYLPPRTR